MIVSATVTRQKTANILPMPPGEATATTTANQTKNIKPSYKSLCRAIEQSNIQLMTRLIKEKPKLLNQPKPNQNILKFACFANNKQAVSRLLQLDQPNVISASQNYVSDTLIDCIRMQKAQIVKLFVNRGFDLGKIVFQKKQSKFTCLDFAILGGHYQIAYYIYQKLSAQKRNIRNISEYQALGKKYSYRHVNYEMFVNGLVNNVPPQNIGDYLKKQLSAKRKQQIRRIYHEGCWDWLMRVLGISKHQVQQQENKKQAVLNPQNPQNAGSTSNMKPQKSNQQNLATQRCLKQPS